jgi:Helix-turn-helix domain of transposase family ISL3/Transposase
VGDAPPPADAGCWLLEGQRLARRDGVRVTTAFSRLLNLRGVWVRQVHFEPDRVVLEVALKRRRLLCPLCEYSMASRKDKRPVDSIWRHLDLGIWRLEIHCRRRRLWCPQHGARTEGVPFARPGSEFTRDFECLVGWLATRTDKTTIKAMLRIDWDTVGRIVKRVCDDELDPGRLNGLFDIGIDEVSWKRQHNYLTLVADHLRGKIVWGTDGAGEKAADRFFEELDPEIAAPPPLHADPGSEDGEPTVGERAAKLRAISLDRGHGYAASARKHAPQAVICIDPYHVVFGLACGSIVLTWLYNGTGGSILACAVWHGLFNLGTGTAGATGTIQGVTSTFVYVQAFLPVGLELRARRRGEASILGPRRSGAPASRRPTLSTR